MSGGLSEPTDRAPLGAYLTPPLPEARLARQWAAVSARPRRRAQPVPRWARAALAAAALFALIGALALVLRRPGGVPAPFEGAAIETAGAGHTWTMPDGAEVLLADATRLRVATWTPERVVLDLEHGEARLDVPHVAGRVWVVRAGRFDVRVVGTRFTVRRDIDARGDRVSVSVERGRVEVAPRDAPGEVRALSAGESWRAEPAGAASASASDAPSAPTLAAELPTGEPDASLSAAPRAAATPSWEDLARARRYKDAYELLGPGGFRAAVDGASAERLFRLAEVARAAGHLRDAELAFDALRRRHRGDGRAGLAAFELGRMRLDSLGDPAGAVEALSDAVQLAPGAPFREDAEARRVQALAASGATAACERARAAYLARYPSGAHAAVVSARCPPR